MCRNILLRSRLLVFSFLIIAFLVISFRNAGLSAAIADEFQYSLFSRLTPISHSAVPSYLYLLIYRLTNVCGSEFYTCAKILNTLFFVAAFPFIYRVARSVASPRVAFCIAAVSILGPVNSYTSYFMPEALYFLGFWVAVWIIFGLDVPGPHLGWVAVGSVIGLCSLIKPHALFLLPAIAVFIAFHHVFREHRPRGTLTIRALGAFVAGALGVKFVGGFLFAGRHGITWFGPLYNSVAASNGSAIARNTRLVEQASLSLIGHLGALCVLFALPVAIIFTQCIQTVRRDWRTEEEQRLFFFTLTTFATLVCVTAIFTASVANSSPYETIARLHMRYYNFALPLLAIVAGAQIKGAKVAHHFIAKLVSCTAVGLVLFYVAVANITAFTPSFIDSPELAGLMDDRSSVTFFIVLQLLCLVTWMVKEKLGAQLFTILVFPATILHSSLQINDELRRFAVADPDESAASYAKLLLSNDEIENLTIVGPSKIGLMMAGFYLDNPKVVQKFVPEGHPVDYSEFDQSKNWVLLLGKYQLPSSACYVHRYRDYMIARLRCADSIQFARNDWTGILDSIEGLNRAESWGVWSSGSTVRLQFSQPLPTHFKLRVAALAFGPNVGKEFIARVGGQSRNFVLPGELKTIELDFDNEERVQSLEIDVPAPVTPKSLGLGEDTRVIGIGLVKLDVLPR